MDPQLPDDDPIVSSYNVFLNPSLPQGRKLWVLQQPNRTDMSQPSASEMRLKSQTGMVELDVPLDYMGSYDRDRGMHYGRHLKNSLTVKQGGTHGLSGGFGVGAPPPQKGKKKTEDRDEDLMMDWTEALRQDKVLRTQTLGGTCPDHKEVQYMIGVFQGEDLHITPVSNLVHLRPQLHHVDAVTHQERLNASSAAAKEASGPSTGGPTGAKAIHMTIKQGGDNDVATTETMLDRLRAVQQEEWRKLKFTDENDEAAWDVYQESLILAAKDAHAKVKKEGGEGNGEGEDVDMDAEDKKGKVKDAADGGDDDDKAKEDPRTTTGPESSDLVQRVPRLETTWDDERLLEAVSGIVKPKILSREEKTKKAEEEEAAAEAARVEAEAKQTRARPRGGAAVGRGRGRGRGGAARGGSSAPNAMDVS